ncbi:indolepyruvate oxidoreductase subunit beta family protein [Marinobacter sp.]|uniref:indolepyruvate oxidoreductase subunit beta family protein n=1 Tax=Marinobacter sp. TaxID=50741 RepID=UPI00384C3DCC
MSEAISKPRPITIAILAMGGQGGGVLSDWITSLAENSDYLAQTTSVPGVAQRTGATIYYVELFPLQAAKNAGQDPVLALMPVPGDVDVVMAAEFMEVGRALQRGLVTPDRTTLIASSHRVYGITEKIVMGNGILDPEPIRKDAEIAARHFIHFDMNATAEAHGSVISAVLFGALAASEVLPMSREAFEDAIRRGGVGVEPSLRAFSAGFAQALGRHERENPPNDQAGAGQQPHSEVRELLERIDARLPEPVRLNAREGIRRLIDFQDIRYARSYLDRLEQIHAAEQENEGDVRNYPVTSETARYLALWMSYEDTIRVADLKTRGKRFKRVHDEVRATDDQIVYVTEFMHPRIEEICDTLPAGLGRRILGSQRLRAMLGRITHRGRHIRTAKLSGFLLLYAIAGLRRWRRHTLRFAEENSRIEAWLERVRIALAQDPALALEVVQCQRLVKGYGDTLARGLGSFAAIMTVMDRHPERPDLPAQVHRLREAGLADEEGRELRSLISELEQGQGNASLLATSRE